MSTKQKLQRAFYLAVASLLLPMVIGFFVGLVFGFILAPDPLFYALVVFIGSVIAFSPGCLIGLYWADKYITKKKYWPYLFHRKNLIRMGLFAGGIEMIVCLITTAITLPFLEKSAEAGMMVLFLLPVIWMGGIPQVAFLRKFYIKWVE